MIDTDNKLSAALTGLESTRKEKEEKEQRIRELEVIASVADETKMRLKRECDELQRLLDDEKRRCRYLEDTNDNLQKGFFAGGGDTARTVQAQSVNNQRNLLGQMQPVAYARPPSAASRFFHPQERAAPKPRQQHQQTQTVNSAADAAKDQQILSLVTQLEQANFAIQNQLSNKKINSNKGKKKIAKT
jgi:hypothetical protein